MDLKEAFDVEITIKDKSDKGTVKKVYKPKLKYGKTFLSLKKEWYDLTIQKN